MMLLPTWVRALIGLHIASLATLINPIATSSTVLCVVTPVVAVYSFTFKWINNVFAVLYCIMRPYTEGPIGPLTYRHSSGVVRNPHSALAEWGIFNLRSISPQGTHLSIAHRRNSITSVLVSISWMTCLSVTCEPRTINLSITGERITFTM